MKVGSKVLLGLALAWATPGAAQTTDEMVCWDEVDIHTAEEQLAACETVLRSDTLSDEDRPYVIAMKGWSNHELGRLDDALTFYTEKIRLQPDIADGYGWRASVYFDQMDYARAIDDFSAAIRLGVDSVDQQFWYHDRAMARHYAGDSAGGLEDMSYAIELNDADSVNWHDRANIYHDIGDHEHALADYTRAINLAPDDPYNWNSRCWTRAVWDRQLVEALDDCNEAIAIDGSDYNFWDSRGLVYLRMERWEDAASDYDASLSLEETASAHYGHGIALQKLGNEQEAEAAFTAALRMDPKIAETYAGYGIEPGS